MGFGGGLNTYGCANQNPVNYIDPNGLEVKPIRVPILVPLPTPGGGQGAGGGGCQVTTLM